MDEGGVSKRFFYLEHLKHKTSELFYSTLLYCTLQYSPYFEEQPGLVVQQSVVHLGAAATVAAR
jgi:hypothetical protein